VPAVVLALCGAHPRRLRDLARAWGRALLRAGGVAVDVRFEAPVPGGPAIYAVNHGSALDIPVLFAALPVDFRFLHKRSLYLVPVVGQYLYLAGHIGIHRRNAFKARHDLARAAERIRGGISVLVFPEGTRSRDGRVARFKRGSFALAIQAGVPVVPVSLAGIKGLAPSGVLSLKEGTVVLTVHPAISTAGLTSDDAHDLAVRVQDIVRTACEAA
jgi:1-acyl-sn-glycerol-3-phosphate acyltransferase